MKRLFFIGNGFDCYEHKDARGIRMKTCYCDFRDYVRSKIPQTKTYYGVPEQSLTMDHHGYEYDKNEIIGYILQILDECQDKTWSSLENALGEDLFFRLFDDLKDVNEAIVSDNDDEMYYAAEDNGLLSSAMVECFPRLRTLFEEWVNNELQNIDYECYAPNSKICTVLSESMNREASFESEFITFNYTLTLEKVYKVPENHIHHFHGKVGDNGEKIIFGHGNFYPIEEYEFGMKLTGAEDKLNDLKEILRKDTTKIICENHNFYKTLVDITDIYSFGFSFSDVDMPYIEELCKYVDPAKITWYFNTYDTKNNPQYIEKVQKIGFNVAHENKW